MFEPAAGLAHFLYPVTPRVFFNEYWERKPLWIKRERCDYYEGLFSKRELDAILSYTRPRDGDIRIVDKSRPELSGLLRRSGWSSSGAASPNMAVVYDAYAQGGTVTVQDLQNRSQALRVLCHMLDAELHHPTTANIYLTPKNAQGFTAHYDKHDVFVAQIEGSKRWQLFDPEYLLPLPEFPDPGLLPACDEGVPDQEIHLMAGDLLYLPRGWGHAASTAECSSLHVTIGVNVYTWKDLVQRAVSEWSHKDVRFREALPPGYLNQNQQTEDLRKRLSELLRSLSEQDCFQSALEALAKKFVADGALVPDGHFERLDHLADIDVNTLVQKRTGGFSYAIAKNEAAILLFSGNQLKGPARILECLRFVSEQTRPFCAKDMPGPLNDNGKVTLVKRLVREGLLKPVSS